MNPTVTVPLKAVTKGPKHHFFGYYDKQQWDPTERYVLGMQTDFMDRSPTKDDVAGIGLIDVEGDGSFVKVAETRAWCWQQGCMLQWLPRSEHTIIYNDRIGDRFVAVILNVKTGERRVLPRPIYTVSPDGKWALSLNFSRLAHTRPGYGYNGLPDPWQHDPAPSEDGIYRMNLATGEHELVVSISDLARHQPEEGMTGATHWVNHLLFNPGSERFIFLHRWAQPGGRFHTRFYTANADGSDRRLMPIQQASHFIWRNDDELLVWAFTEEAGRHYYLCSDSRQTAEPLGAGVLTRDGHCTYSPDGRWVLTDEYPDGESMRPLILYRLEDGTRLDIARVLAPPELTGELRCDLHPRWSPSGRKVCIDSAHEGSRQIYVADVSDIVSGNVESVAQ